MNKVKDLRQDKDMSQTALGKIIGVTAMSISHWENGLSEIPAAMISKMADLFCVSADEVLGRKPPAPKVIYKEIDNVYSYMITKLKSLSNSELLRLQGAVESLLYDRNSSTGVPIYQKSDERGTSKKGN